ARPATTSAGSTRSRRESREIRSGDRRPRHAKLSRKIRGEAGGVNIVFDLGGVVVAYDRPTLVARLYADPAVRAAVNTALLEHPDWIAMDRGTLSEAAAIARAARRSGVAAREFARFIDEMVRAWTPIPGSVELLRELRAAGHTLFCLSNMHPV